MVKEGIGGSFGKVRGSEGGWTAGRWKRGGC